MNKNSSSAAQLLDKSGVGFGILYKVRILCTNFGRSATCLLCGRTTRCAFKGRQRQLMRNSARKSWLAALGMFALLLVSLVFAACADKPSAYTLTFETNGGTKIDPVTAEAGATVTPPDDPEKEGFVFDGWYLSADFTGEAVSIPSTMPSENVTYYAKFDKIATAALTLNAGLGTLTQTSFELEVGTDVFEYVSAIVPAAPEGLTFGGWFVGESETLLAAGTKLPEAGISLTARYTVPYTVEVYKQTAAGSEEYTLASDVTVDGGSGFVGDKVDISSALGSVTGYTLNAEKTQSITLKAEGGNVYKAYYDLRAYTIYYFDNAPSGAESTGEMPNGTAYYGEESTLPQCAFAIEGYRFAGWSTSASGSVEYAAGEKLPAVKGTVILYACWNRGLKDSNGGGDVLYVLQEQPGKVLLERADMVQTGSYNAEERTFWFGENANDDTLPRGRVSANGENFAYYYGEFELTYSQYDWTSGEVTSVSLTLDGIDGAVYQPSAEASAIEGTYVYADGEYLFTSADDAQIEPTTFYFQLATLTESKEDVFLIRDDFAGTFYAYASNSINYPIALLDGYGTVIFRTEEGMASGSYTVLDKENAELQFVFASETSEVSYIVQMGLVQISGQYVPVFMLSDDLRGEYTFALSEGTNPGTMKVELNGFGELDYTFTPNDTSAQTVNGTTQYRQLVSYTQGSGEDGRTYYVFYFMVGSGDAASVYPLRVTPGVKEATLVGTEVGIYSQYNMTNGLTAQLFMRGDGTAVLSVLMSDGSYMPVIEGEYNELADAQGEYTFTAKTYVEMDAEMEAQLKEAYGTFRYTLLSSSSSVVFAVHDGHSETYTFSQTLDDETTEYILTLGGYGIATLKGVGSENTENVSYSFGDGYGNYTFLYIVNGYGSTFALRIDKNDPDTGTLFWNEGSTGTANQFVNMAGSHVDLLERIGVDGEEFVIYPDGHAIVYDKYGSIVAEGSVQNTTSEESILYEYTFTASGECTNDDYKSFAFAYSSAAFMPFAEDEVAELTLYDTDLTLTGFGVALYGSSGQYYYEIEAAEDGHTYLILTSTSGSVAARLRYDNKTLSQPGTEMGTYYNVSTDEEGETIDMLSLDGYGNATLTRGNLTTGEAIQVATGTYTGNNTDGYVVTWTDGTKLNFVVTVVSMSGVTLLIYVPSDDEGMTYTIMQDSAVMGVLERDDFGRVVYTDADGNSTSKISYLVQALDGENYLLLAVYDDDNELVASALFLVTDDDPSDKEAILTATDGMVGKYVLVSGKSILTEQTLVLDGIGGAEWTKADGTKVEGTYAPVEGSATEWKFTAKDGGETFTFTLVSVSAEGESYSAYIVYDEGMDGKYISSDWQMVTTDGYMTATFVDFYGNVYSANYESLENGTVLHIYSSALGDLYLRIDEDSFTDITDTYAPEADAA